MVERVQVSVYSADGQRALAWLAAGYCAAAAVVFTVDFPALLEFCAFFVVCAAAPAVIRPRRAFRLAVGLSITLIAVFSVLFYFFGGVQLAAVIPLALALTPAPTRAPLTVGLASAGLLLVPIGFLAAATW